MNTTPQTFSLGKRNMDYDSFHTSLPYVSNNFVPSTPIKKGRRDISLDGLVPINLFQKEFSGYNTPIQHHNFNNSFAPIRDEIKHISVNEVTPMNLFSEEVSGYNTPNHYRLFKCPPIERNINKRLFSDKNLTQVRLEQDFNESMDIYIKFPEIMI
jgi:hypothetical protein